MTFEGVYVRMVYDDSATGGGRLSEKQFFDNAVAYNNGSGTPTERLVYTYDAFGRIVQQQHIRPTVTDSYTTVYDAQGRVTQETTPTGFIKYEYDLLGRKTKTQSGTTLPTVLSEVTYTYDLLGRLSTVNTVKRAAPRHNIQHFCVRELGAMSMINPALAIGVRKDLGSILRWLIYSLLHAPFWSDLTA